MPFTPAHPAAVLPFFGAFKAFGGITALVIGSMVPDIVYFLPLGATRDETHTFFGVLWFCLPVGLVFYCLFYALFAPLVYTLSPVAIRSRLPQSWRSGQFVNPIRLTIMVGIVIGSVTHIVWDAFTHQGGLPTEWIPLLNAPLLQFGGYTLYGYKVLQHLSTFLGTAAIAWVLWRAYQRHEPAGPQSSTSSKSQWICWLLLIIPPALTGLVAGLGRIDSATGVVAQAQAFLGAAIFSGGTVFLVCVMVVSVGLAVLRNRTA